MVIAVIAILAALLLPAIDRARSRSKRAKCVSQLNQIGVAFHAFGHDHDDRFPQSVPLASGGVLEFAAAATALQDLNLVPRIFRALSNELVTPELLVCPSSRDRSHFSASTFGELTNGNVSYFIGLNAIPYNTDSWLAGDSWGDVAGAFVSVTADIRWLRAWSFVHAGRCNILFADGHVESLAPSQMVAELSSPQFLVQPAPGSSGGGGIGGGTASASGTGSSGAGAGVSGSGTPGYPSGSAAGSAGSGQRGGGTGARSGFTALENYFQPKPPAQPAGGNMEGAYPSIAPTFNSRTEPASISFETSRVVETVTRITNRVSATKTNTQVETNVPASDVRSNVTVVRWLGDITPEEKSFLRWWLVLAILAIIVGVVAGTRRRKPSRRHR